MIICIFGDSITWGAHDPEQGGWATRLRNCFKARDKDIDSYNLGVSGDNTADLLERIENECRTRKPDVVIIAIGINDSQYVHSEDNRRVPLEGFKENLEKLYKIARQFTKKIIFVGLTEVDELKTRPVPWNTDKSYDNEGIKQYDLAINNFCQKNRLKFISMQEVLEKSDLEDGLHPNPQGHKKMLNKIRPEIENIVTTN